MKISKLFHWLYAILMLLPFAFFVPSVLYYAFNDNATMQNVEVPKTETISVDFNQKVKSEYFYLPGTVYGIDRADEGEYGFRYTGTSTTTATYTCVNLPLEVFDTTHLYYVSFGTNFVPTGTFLNLNAVDNTNDYYYGYLGFSNFGLTIPAGITIDYLCFPQMIDITQMFGVGNEPSYADFKLMFPNAYYPYTESELMQITYDTGETMELVENTSIVNYAWESIWDLPLFSWTKVTFIAVPFTYITGLFGLAASNSINYVFGYFLSISIVWLVFDIIMYVPLLCHRWIDKARLE